MGPIPCTGSVPKMWPGTVLAFCVYRHCAIFEPNFPNGRRFYKKVLTFHDIWLTSWNLGYQRIDNIFQIRALVKFGVKNGSKPTGHTFSSIKSTLNICRYMTIPIHSTSYLPDRQTDTLCAWFSNRPFSLRPLSDWLFHGLIFSSLLQSEWKRTQLVKKLLFKNMSASFSSIVKGVQSYLFSIFSNFWRFWYHKDAHIFLITLSNFTAEICSV